MSRQFKQIFELVSPLVNDDEFTKNIVGKAEETIMKKSTENKSRTPIYALSAAVVAIAVIAGGIWFVLGGNEAAIDILPNTPGEASQLAECWFAEEEFVQFISAFAEQESILIQYTLAGAQLTILNVDENNIHDDNSHMTWLGMDKHTDLVIGSDNAYTEWFTGLDLEFYNSSVYRAGTFNPYWSELGTIDTFITWSGIEIDGSDEYYNAAYIINEQGEAYFIIGKGSEAGNHQDWWFKVNNPSNPPIVNIVEVIPLYIANVRQTHKNPDDDSYCDNTLYFIISEQRACSSCCYIFTGKQNEEIGFVVADALLYETIYIDPASVYEEGAAEPEEDYNFTAE